MVSVKWSQKLARRIMNAKLGQIVHHIDGNPLNNDPANLMLLDSYQKHAELHERLGDPPSWNGRKHTNETKRKMSISQKKRYSGRGLSEEIRKKISKIRKEQCKLNKPNNPMFGKEMSEAHKRKISEAMKRYHASRKT